MNKSDHLLPDGMAYQGDHRYTEAEILQAIEKVLCFDSWKQESRLHSLTRAWVQAHNLDTDTAAEVLRELGVQLPQNRIDHHNIAKLDIDDLMTCCNNWFQVVACDRCGKQLRSGQDRDTCAPWGQDDECLTVTIPELGTEALLCADCLVKLQEFFA